MSKTLNDLIDHLRSKNLLSDELRSELESYFETKKKCCKTIPFGKYRGKSIAEVLLFDRKYLDWLSRQSFVFEDLKTEIDKQLIA
jgi:hypothetical protein